MNQAPVAGLLLAIQRSLRQAQNLSILRFCLVSDIRRLFDYQQALLMQRQAGGRLRVAAVSNVATLDTDAPYIVFVERVLKQLDSAGTLATAAPLSEQNLADSERGEWREFLAEHALWQPLQTPTGEQLGGLLLVRPQPWNATEAVLLEEIADAGAHAWQALERPRHRLVGRGRRSHWVIAAIVTLLAALCVPVRFSAIAPAEVTAKDPTVIAAPINGVIAEIHIKPNTPVTQGQRLFTYEDAELKANHSIALRAVDEAEAELRRASQQGFGDPQSRAEVALLKAQLALRREQADYSAYQLSQVEFRAPNDGIVIFDDPNEWRGRPVSTGERVMMLATPSEGELAIYLPVADAITLQPEAEVRLFLDVRPLQPINARLERASYQPVTTAAGVLSYLVVARFEAAGQSPRIGLQGSAKVLGEPVPLALFLFRRPLSALRQMVGF